MKTRFLRFLSIICPRFGKRWMVVGTEVCEIYDTGLCLHLFIDAGLTEDPTIMHDFSNAESLLQNSSVSLLMDY